MLKKYKEFKRAVDHRNEWLKECDHYLYQSILENNEQAKSTWSNEWVKALDERDALLGSNIKYAVIYKLTHKRR